MTPVCLLVAIVAFAAAIPKSNEEDGIGFRIADGKEVTRHSIPYQVLLVTTFPEKLGITSWRQCGGSLISQNYVLTAGHCVIGGVEVKTILRAHYYHNDEDNKQFSTEFKTHEKYKPGTINNTDYVLNDIALIKLPKPVKVTDIVNIVALPTRNDINKVYIGLLATISGWRKTSDNDFFNSPKPLEFAIIKIITNDKCGYLFNDDTPLLCAFYYDGKPCGGDSGGPLVVDGVQVGLDSFGVPEDDSKACSSLDAPAAFTKIAPFLDWIEANSDVKIKDN